MTIKNWELGHTEPEIRHGPAIIDFLKYAPTARGENLPERLRSYRWIRGYSQEAAAKDLGVDTTTWRKWEASLSSPGRSSALRIKAILSPTLAETKYLDEIRRHPR